MPNTLEATEKYRFTKSKAKLESFKLASDETATAKLTFDDPAKLTTVDVLRLAALERRREGDVEHLTIRINNPEPHDFDDKGKAGPRVHLTLPGTVVEANHNATVDGKTVAWRFGLAEFLHDRVVELTASYRMPAPPAAAPAKDAGRSAN
jgi:hypothetical protein